MCIRVYVQTQVERHLSLSIHIYIYNNTYIYIYMYMNVYMCVYIYTYICRYIFDVSHHHEVASEPSTRFTPNLYMYLYYDVYTPITAQPPKFS